MVEKLVGLSPKAVPNFTPTADDKKGIKVNGKTVYPNTIEYTPEYIEKNLKTKNREKAEKPTIIYSKDICELSNKKSAFGPSEKENTMQASISPKQVCEWGAAAKIIVDLLLYGYDAVVDRWGKGNADKATFALMNACAEKECAEKNSFECVA